MRPLTANISVSRRCNSRCSYCLIWQQNFEDAETEGILRAVDQLALLGTWLVNFGGGEPLLHPELLKMVHRVYAHGMVSSVCTNGLLATYDRVAALFDAGLGFLVLSLDTVDPETFHSIRGVSLEHVLSRLEDILEARKAYPHATVSINCVVSKANRYHLLPLIKYCADRGISVGFQPLHPAFACGRETDLSFSQDDYPALEQLINELIVLKQLGSDTHQINSSEQYLRGFPAFLASHSLPEGFICRAGETSVSIDCDLLVKSCWSMPPIGNLKETDLPSLWHSENYRLRREAMNRGNCPGCWLRCHAENRSDDWINWISMLAKRTTSSRDDQPALRGAV